MLRILAIKILTPSFSTLPPPPFVHFLNPTLVRIRPELAMIHIKSPHMAAITNILNFGGSEHTGT